MSVGRMPNGKEAKTAREYIKAWAELYEPLEQALELAIMGYDPGLLMREANGHATVSIPTWLARRMVAALRNNVQGDERTP
jgi:hypothetical protein